jgi:hypothetical protein
MIFEVNITRNKTVVAGAQFVYGTRHVQTPGFAAARREIRSCGLGWQLGP